METLGWKEMVKSHPHLIAEAFKGKISSSLDSLTCKYFALGFNFLPQWDFNFLPHKGGFALALCHWDFNFLPHKGGFE